MKNKLKYVPKGWGGEVWIVNKEQYCGKRLLMIKDHQLSVHYHIIKDETFYIAEGVVEVKYLEPDKWKWDADRKPEEYLPNWQVGRKSQLLEKGDTFYVPPFMMHQLIAKVDSEILEFSTQHFDEDSYRVVKGD